MTLESAPAHKVLAREAYLNFCDLLDYIWKTPRLIEREHEQEREKLEAYFPIKGDAESDAFALKLRASRWAIEESKLSDTFPSLMAGGNLFSAASLYEIYCLKLGKLIERESGILIASCKGQGLCKRHCDPKLPLSRQWIAGLIA